MADAVAAAVGAMWLIPLIPLGLPGLAGRCRGT